MRIPEDAPIPAGIRTALNPLLAGLDDLQLAWLSGFLVGWREGRKGGGAAAPGAVKGSGGKVTVLYGTESGNSEGLARRTAQRLKELGREAQVWDMADFPRETLAGVETLLVAVSTWGDGDPPERAVELHRWLLSDAAPRLEKTRFSVLALGDTGYAKFCQTGREWDARLEALGGQRLAARADCDVDFEEPFLAWLGRVEVALQALGGPGESRLSGTRAADEEMGPGALPGRVFDRKNPFKAVLQERILLNGRGSAKETWHLEFSLAGAGMGYTPGDALGVFPENRPEEVERLLVQTGLEGERDWDGSEPGLTVREALQTRMDITALSRTVVEKYAGQNPGEGLRGLLAEERKEELLEWMRGRHLADLFEAFPKEGYSVAELRDLTRKLPPRLYSIASSLRAHPEAVHLTVGAVKYRAHGREREGVASCWLGERLGVGQAAPVYVQENRNFRLPEDPGRALIMVGPGTGIAPFRAFLQERRAAGAYGRNWLFFGDQHFQSDFLYQLEWQELLREGVLTKMNTAFSRDQEHKIYVQHRMREEGRELFAWLCEGAHFYVCGDAQRMAGDVHEALIRIFEEHGGMKREAAESEVRQLQREKRYQRDVY